MKDRFGALDVRVIIANFQENFLGMRVSNIYDINPRTYMIKLQETGKDKKLIMIESGMRVHSTKYMRDIPKIPSIFTLKLRKHVRSKRLVAVRQLGIDRVIDFTFGSNEAAYHIIVELHSKGNVILTDYKYSIVTLLRTFKPKNSDTFIATNHLYPVEAGDYQELNHITLPELVSRLADAPQTLSLKQFLMKSFDFGSAFIQHCILRAGQQPNMKLSQFDKSQLDVVHEELMKAEEFIANAKGKLPGWIIMRNTKEEAAERIAEEKKKEEEKKEGEEESTSPTGPLFDSFTPIVFEQFKNQESREFATFDESVDEFFSKIESQKINVQKSAKASVVTSKLGKVKHDQTKRIAQLETKAEEYHRKALLVQDNADDVEKAVLIIRSAIANSIDWAELAAIVKEEKRNGDRIAEIIYELKLDTNHITVLLSNIPYDSSEEDLTGEPEVVAIDISLSAHANVQRYFDMKKQAESKKEKTEASVSQALKAAQKKAERDIKQVKVKQGIQKLRKQLWFEKFYWFVSSDNYVVVSGRDAQQNELIVKRYMQKGDLYIHADIHGASTCVIKNHTGKVVPPTTLEQAGQMAICRSAAWGAKVVTSAYWVYHHQVSKTAPSGEYLTTGSFMIRGKKNFLPPAQLVMGFGLLFRLDESCVGRHAGERRSKLGTDEILPPSPRGSTRAQEDAEDNKQFEKLDAETFTPDTDKEVDDEEDEEQVDDEEEEEEDEQGEETDEKQEEGKSSFQPAHLGIPDKYRIDFLDGDDEEEEEEEKEKQEGKKRISKRERRLMKKGIDPTTVAKQPAPQLKAKETTSEPQKQLTRRERNKLKKIKAKYGDQDEEERAIRMKILGSAGKPSETDKTLDSHEDHTEGEKVPRPVKTEKEEKLDREKGQKIKEQREQSLQALTSEAMSNTSLLDELTGKPLEDDVLIYGIPMCGPYSAVKDFKFKVKLIPGSSKTGRAVSTTINIFKNTTGVTQQEKETISLINDTESMLQMMGGVKVSTPGLANKAKKGKKGKKGKFKK